MAGPEKIRNHVQNNRSKYLDLLNDALRFPSISTEGQGLDEMAAWLESKLISLGASVGRLQVPGSPPALVGEIAGRGERVLMIYDHYDVQPVDPLDLWDSPPFEPVEKEGRIYARGAADNKGDLVARLCAVEAYRELFGEIPFTIKFFIEGEEETGSPHFHDICNAHAERLRADDCVWEGGGFDHAGRPNLYFGCKGLLYVEITAKKLAGDQHSSLAVYAPSAAWELVRALSSIKDEDGRVTIKGFYDHVLEPSDRERAMIEALDFEESSERDRLGIDEFDRGLTGEALKRELFYSPTANIAGLYSGYMVPGATKTVLPAQATAKMDFRLVPDQRGGDIAEKLIDHFKENGLDVEVTVLSAENPSRSPVDSVLGKAMQQAAETWFPKPLRVWPLMYATGPMYPIAQGLGIPISSPPGVGRPDSKVHAPNENVRIDDYLEVVGYTVAYLEAYGR